MSQHLATATLDGHPVEIVAGFDRRLGDYFLQVIDERNDMLYTSLQEPLLDWTDIATLRTKVAELGLRLPAQLVDEVEGDGRRRAGNRIVRHLADGPPVTLMAADAATSDRPRRRAPIPSGMGPAPFLFAGLFLRQTHPSSVRPALSLGVEIAAARTPPAPRTATAAAR
jgi:hypothetical protein